MTKSLFQRWRQLDGHQRALLVEAVVALAAASAAVRLLPFRQAVRLGSRAVPANGREPASAIADQVRWAIEAAARRVPWRAVCIQQGVALQWMLRRRGLDALLHYGIGKGEAGELKAHVWVAHGDRILIGGEEAPAFRHVATYPQRL